MPVSTQTILAVDDKKENLDVLLNILDDFDVIPTTSSKKAIEIAKNDDISLVLLDIMMPEMDGFEVCKRLKADQKTKDIPIIFITAKTDEESIAIAYKAGANDYVSKPLKKTEVIERVKTQLRLKKTIAELEFLASRDGMTGIYNRRKFFELAEPLFSESNENLFVSMIDIDHFKKINDSYGHDVGDVVIKLVAKTVSDMLPVDAIFGRIGGEEFAVALSLESKESVLGLFEKIKEKISSLFLEHDKEVIRFTISNGIAQKSSETKSLDQLLKLADTALYEAKGSGRNRVIFR